MSEGPRQATTSMPYSNPVRGLVQLLWLCRIRVAVITLVAAAIGVVLALIVRDVYRAEALLAPNLESGQTNLANLASRYGNLMQLEGLNFGSRSGGKTTLGIETAKSRQFITSFVTDRDLLVPLMAAKGWNRETGTLLIDADIYDEATGAWVRDVSPPRAVVPSEQEAYDRFREVFHISKDKKSGYVTISVTHYSPEIARQWVEWLIDDLNAKIQEDDTEDARRAIEYLNEQIAETSLSEVRQVFFELIGEQQKTMMLANANKEYVFKTVDPALAPEKRHAPNRILIVLSSLFLGFVLGCMAAVAFPPKMMVEPSS